MVESIPQDTAKARRKAKPRTAAEPTGAVVGHGKRVTIYSESLIRAEDKVDDRTILRRLKRGVYKIEADGLHKRCSRCKEYWPADSEFFYTQKNAIDGLYAWCKACYQEWRYPNGRKKQEQLESPCQPFIADGESDDF